MDTSNTAKAAAYLANYP
jgi:hypothetical protein